MRLFFLLLACIAITAAGVLVARPTHAGALNAGDRAYADTFGNLVIEGATGYKRIVVGEGSRAAELQNFIADRPHHAHKVSRKHRDCYRPGLWLKGRSHMYGVSFGELPPLAPCR